MTQSSFFSWDTDGTGDGTATGYTQAQLKTLLHMLLAGGVANEGPRTGYLNGLAPSNPSSSTIRVATGGALVYGIPYTNDAQIDFTPGDGTYPALPTTARIHRVVLQASWSAQTVRLAFISGTDAGSPSTPSLTQTAGTTWEIPICQFQINSAGTVSSFTDQREFLDRLVHRRQGGSIDSWFTVGTTNYIPRAPRIQCGVVEISFAASATAQVSVTFPVAFTQIPWVTGICNNSLINMGSVGVSETGAGITGRTVDASTPTATYSVLWLAIGEI